MAERDEVCLTNRQTLMDNKNVDVGIFLGVGAHYIFKTRHVRENKWSWIEETGLKPDQEYVDRV